MRNNFRIRDFLINSTLLLLSISLSMIICEAFLRIILDPVDYLMPYIVYDPILGGKVMPNSAGHDSWGYRNKSIPASTYIVAIGDSQTYGVSATASNSWPAKLGKMLNRSVYNLSLGAYNPVHYSYLLENKAMLLNPSLIIVGFYYGNDIIGAYNTVYSNDYWSHLRRPYAVHDVEVLSDDTLIKENLDTKFMGRLRDWAAHHSVFYRKVTDYFGEMLRSYDMQYNATDDITVLEKIEPKIRTVLTPKLRLNAVNLHDPKIQEGLRISLELFSQMNELCITKDVSLLVVLIPTKESVFSRHIEDNYTLKNSDSIESLIKNEHRVNDLVKKRFQEKNIIYIDVLESLKNAVGKKPIYPSNQDGHPLKDGYEIIARAIHSALR